VLAYSWHHSDDEDEPERSVGGGERSRRRMRECIGSLELYVYRMCPLVLEFSTLSSSISLFKNKKKRKIEEEADALLVVDLKEASLSFSLLHRLILVIYFAG